ncbi:hypothetical protein ACFCXG_17115 [Streptomyces sp. NPDC056295]|uniref:hypothetical protein n=1 Tax=Streptomyces sp. NPDC056295 TaxID=3345774 RepID=UPI0035DE4F20
MRLPPTATEAKAAHLEGLQDDGLIMAFVFPAAEVDGFVVRASLTPGSEGQHTASPVTPRRIVVTIWYD